LRVRSSRESIKGRQEDRVFDSRHHLLDEYSGMQGVAA
jgi:hypothetical protein